MCCHVGGDIDFDAAGQPLPVHRRRHQPVRVRRLRADRRADRPQPGLRRAALRGQHQRPARQDPADQARTRTARTPSRPATCSRPGTAKTRPEIYAMGFRNPFRMSVDKADRHRLPRRLRPRRRRRRRRTAGPAARSSSTGSPRPATTAGRTAPAPTPPPRPTTSTTSPPAPSGAEVQLRRRADQQLVPQHRPDHAARGQAGLDPLRRRRRLPPEFGGGSESPMGGPVYRYDADARTPP